MWSLHRMAEWYEGAAKINWQSGQIGDAATSYLLIFHQIFF